MIIGFEQTSVTVPEDVGTFALCLNVSTQDLTDGLLPAGFDVFIDLDTIAGTAGIMSQIVSLYIHGLGPVFTIKPTFFTWVY